MRRILAGLQPEPVFRYFEEISLIPRGSGNEKAISDYLVDFAKHHQLEVIQEENLNVIIRKPASPGYESAPTVILQGHMDMVCEKNHDTIHDFEKDPIRLRIIDDMIYATDTTLGADNGIAIAYALAILSAKDIPHPPLEVIMTVEEETGLGGATALDSQHVTGKYLINLDSEEEGEFLVSCAGGVRTRQILPISHENVPQALMPYKISIRGLKGGHSGMDINKGRGNSNKIMGRILNDLSSAFPYHLGSINGGSKMNAIPREADALILLDKKYIPVLESKIQEWNTVLKNELRSSDADVSVKTEKYEGPSISSVFTEEIKNKVITSLLLIPNGVQTMSMDIDNLVESSTNLGVVTTSDEDIRFESATRSSVRSLKYGILSQGKSLAESLGCQFVPDSEYPEWEYNPESELRNLFLRVYKNFYGKEAKVIAIHAGVECGILKEKKADLDMISLGPNMYDVHTPNEHLSISSTQRTWDFLLAVLKEIR